MENVNHITAKAVAEAANRRAAMEAQLTYAARERYNFLLVEQRRERYRQTQRLAELKKNYEWAAREPGLTWKTSSTLRHAAWRYAAQLRLMTYLRKGQDQVRHRFLEREAAGKLYPKKPLPSPDEKASFRRAALEALPPKQYGSREQRAATADKSVAEAAFSEAANKRAALEARLSEQQRRRYLTLRQKQQTALERQERRLEARREDYEAEVRKHGIAPRLDMIPIDRNTPRALREAAREYAAQGQWVDDLRKAHEREWDKFLERAIAAEPEPESLRIEGDKPRRRPSQE